MPSRTLGPIRYVVRLSNGTYTKERTRKEFTKSRAGAERYTLKEARHVRDRVRREVDNAAEIFNAD